MKAFALYCFLNYGQLIRFYDVCFSDTNQCLFWHGIIREVVNAYLFRTISNYWKTIVFENNQKCLIPNIVKKDQNFSFDFLPPKWRYCSLRSQC